MRRTPAASGGAAHPSDLLPHTLDREVVDRVGAQRAPRKLALIPTTSAWRPAIAQHPRAAAADEQRRAWLWHGFEQAVQRVDLVVLPGEGERLVAEEPRDHLERLLEPIDAQPR